MIIWSFLLGLAFGSAPLWALARNRVLQPQPVRIVEAELLTAEAIDAAVRGD